MANAARPEKAAKMIKFGFFPNEALANEKGINLAILLREGGEHHTTIEAATDQCADGAVHLP